MLKKVSCSLIFVVIFFVNFYSLKPILKSGYYFDDTLNSQTKSYLSYNNKSVIGFTSEITGAWIAHGRILPGFLYTYAPWVYLFNSLISYKIFLIAMHLAVILAFSFLMFKLTRSFNVLLLMLPIIPIFFQFRRSPDPVTSFGFLVPIILLKLSLSLIFLKEYLTKNKKCFLILSLLFYLLMLLMFYEITYVFFPIVIYIVYFHKEKLFSTLKLSFPYIFLSFIFIGVYFYVLTHATTGTYNGSTINLNIKLVISSFLKQVSGSLPLSYFFVSRPQFFHINLLDYVYGSILSATTFVSLFFYKLKKQRSLLLVSVGFLLVFLSTLPISLSQRYQLEVAWGIGYLPVYIAYFGTASILIGVILSVVNKLNNGFLRKVFILIVSILIGIAGFLNLQNNKLVVEDLNYIFKYPRELIESSLKTKLTNNIQENGTIITLNGYPWDNSSFYSDAAKKRLELIDLESFTTKSINKKKFDNLNIISNVKNTYVINYKLVNKDLGYVYAGQVTDIYYIDKDQKIIFIKKLRIYIQKNFVYKYIDYRNFSNANQDDFVKHRIELNQSNLLEKKRDNYVYEINSDEPISFESIKLINPNNPTEIGYQNIISSIEKNYKDNLFIVWKEGFSGLEGDLKNNWRWATNRNKLSIINLDSYIKPIKIKMMISSGYEEPSNFNLNDVGVGSGDNLKINIKPIAYEKIIYLQPGVNFFMLTSDSKKIINSDDPRDLRFKISDFKIESIN